MDEDQDKNQNTETEVSEEEKQSEAEALAEVKDDELKTKIAEELGIDPEDEPELLEKAVKMKKADLERTSKAIKQKIGWREKATKKTSQKPKSNSEEGESQQKGNALTEDDLNRLLDEREAKRDLENLNLPDEIKSEVKDLAKVKGISVREAAKLPYIESRIQEVEKAKRIESATPKRKGKGSYSNIDVDPSKPLNPNDFALDTEEGQKAWNEAKAARRKYRQSN